MATAPARTEGLPAVVDAAQKQRRRRPEVERFLPHEIPDGVRLGRGSLIDFDARLGLPASNISRSPGLLIGEAAAIRGGAAIYMGCDIGRNVDVGFNVVIREDTVIGNFVRIGDNTIIGRGCSIGDRVSIDENCTIGPQTTIEDDVHVASSVATANDPHPGSASAMCARGPVLSRGAQIGTNATVLPFVVVGKYALVGAGSVVTRDVRSGTVVVGNPARFLKNTSDVRCPLDLPDGSYMRTPARTAV